MALRLSRIQSWRDYSKLYFNSNLLHYSKDRSISKFSTYSLFEKKSNYLLVSHLPSLTCALQKTTAAEMLGLPTPPKRPLAPFIRYVVQEGERFPGLSMTEKSSKLGEAWNALDERIKAKYKEEFEKELEIYKKKQAEYLDSLTPGQIEEIKELKSKIKFDKKVSLERKQLRKECERMGKPKHPGNPVTAFIESYKAEKKLPQKNVLTTMISMWNELPKSQQEEFKLLAENKMVKYKADLHKWETKMLKEGRHDLVKKEDPAKTSSTAPKKENVGQGARK